MLPFSHITLYKSSLINERKGMCSLLSEFCFTAPYTRGMTCSICLGLTCWVCLCCLMTCKASLLIKWGSQFQSFIATWTGKRLVPSDNRSRWSAYVWIALYATIKLQLLIVNRSLDRPPKNVPLTVPLFLYARAELSLEWSTRDRSRMGERDLLDKIENLFCSSTINVLMFVRCSSRNKLSA